MVDACLKCQHVNLALPAASSIQHSIYHMNTSHATYVFALLRLCCAAVACAQRSTRFLHAHHRHRRLARCEAAERHSAHTRRRTQVTHRTHTTCTQQRHACSHAHRWGDAHDDASLIRMCITQHARKQRTHVAAACVPAMERQRRGITPTQLSCAHDAPCCVVNACASCYGMHERSSLVSSLSLSPLMSTRSLVSTTTSMDHATHTSIPILTPVERTQLTAFRTLLESDPAYPVQDMHVRAFCNDTNLQSVGRRKLIPYTMSHRTT